MIVTVNQMLWNHTCALTTVVPATAVFVHFTLLASSVYPIVGGGGPSCAEDGRETRQMVARNKDNMERDRVKTMTTMAVKGRLYIEV